MSEFTAGTLFLYDDLLAITEAAQTFSDKCRVEKLNHKWGVFLMRDDFLTESNSIHELLKISCKAPIIYFVNAQDHGWGYKVMQNEKVIASLDVNYELEHQFFLDIAEQKYPDEDPYCLSEELTRAIHESIPTLPAYIEKVNSQFKHANVEVFRLFGVKSSELERIFQLDYINGLAIIHDLVDEFKSILDINDMEWVNFDTDFSTR